MLGLLHPAPGGGGAALRLSWSRSLSPPRSLEKGKKGGGEEGMREGKGGEEVGVKEEVGQKKVKAGRRGKEMEGSL